MTGGEKRKLLLFHRYNVDDIVRLTDRTIDSQGRETTAQMYYGKIATLKDDGTYVIRYKDRFDQKGNLIACDQTAKPVGDTYVGGSGYNNQWPPPECYGQWAHQDGTWMRVDDGTSDDIRPESPSVPEDNNGNSGEISKFAHKYVALVRDRDQRSVNNCIPNRARTRDKCVHVVKQSNARARRC